MGGAWEPVPDDTSSLYLCSEERLKIEFSLLIRSIFFLVIVLCNISSGICHRQSHGKSCEQRQNRGDEPIQQLQAQRKLLVLLQAKEGRAPESCGFREEALHTPATPAFFLFITSHIHWRRSSAAGITCANRLRTEQLTVEVIILYGSHHHTAENLTFNVPVTPLHKGVWDANSIRIPDGFV